MKKIQKYMMIALAGMLITLAAGCQKEPLAEEDFSQDYDIPWIVSTITNVTPLTARAGETVTITGTNLDTDILPPTTFSYYCFDMGGTEFCIPIGIESSGVMLGTTLCEIVSQSSTQVVFQVPSNAFATTKPVEISIINYHNRIFVYKDKFTPVL
ncbi:MAG: IPT/TIG domain-containing protein [Prevotellaceae bacterium]|nr:IPT/TIG domain-containing protein [Prevotellaceae bacterium]